MIKNSTDTFFLHPKPFVTSAFRLEKKRPKTNPIAGRSLCSELLRSSHHGQREELSAGLYRRLRPDHPAIREGG